MFPPISISGSTQAGSTAVAVGSARCAAPRRGWRQSPARARCVTARSTGISILAVLVGTVIHQATFRVGRMGSWPFGQNTRTPAGQQFASFQRPVPSIYSSASPWVGSQPCGAQYPGLRCPPYFASLLPRRTPLRILNGTIRRVSRNVKRWKSPFHGSPMDRSWRRHRQKKFRRIKGYRHMGALVHALRSKHKLLICGLLQKGRVLAQDGVSENCSTCTPCSCRA